MGGTYREEDGDLEEVDLPHHLLEHHFVDGGARGGGGGEDDGDEDLLPLLIVHVGQQRDACGGDISRLGSLLLGAMVALSWFFMA